MEEKEYKYEEKNNSKKRRVRALSEKKNERSRIATPPCEITLRPKSNPIELFLTYL